VFVGVPADAAAAHATLVHARGVWTLPMLGYGDQTFPLRRDRERVTLAYRLPRGAQQGARDWYLVRLNFRARLGRRSGAGLAYVSALTNGRAAAQIKLEVARVRGRLHTTWSGVGLVDGRVERTTTGRTLDVRFANYLQLAGVRPGRNQLVFQYERYGNARFDRLRIIRDSGIEVSPLSPARLRLTVRLPSATVAVGDTFTVPFRLTNDGDRAAKEVVVTPQFAADALRLVGAPTRRFPLLPRSAEGAFRFKALAPGAYDVVLGVRSSTNRPAAVIRVPIQPAGAKGGIGAGAWLALLALLALLVGVTSVALRRGRRSPRAQSPTETSR
jgi:hypothetical protein